MTSAVRASTEYFWNTGCQTTSYSRETYSGDAENDPSNSKLHVILARGEQEKGTVRVALFRPAVTPQMSKTVDAVKLFALWRAEFENDGRIDLVSQRKVDKAGRDEAKGKYNFFRLGNAARVHCVVSHKMKAGFDRRQRKIVRMPVMVLTATVESKVTGMKQQFSVEGSLLRNLELLKKLAAEVKRHL